MIACSIACSVVVFRLDYCNAVLYRAPLSELDKLQRAQNNRARVVYQRNLLNDAKTLLQSLHWPPVRECILYTTTLLTFMVWMYGFQRLHRTCSSCERQHDCCGPPTLMLIVPRTQTALATCAFFVAVSTVWNASPSLYPLSGTLYRQLFGCATRCRPSSTN